ncbi:hypothetical protein Cgig2_007576 [Carnegiea gigantea]|uniref:Major facilitator superfamily (MFS) profile domain-containing protein n=1 Tax=Carnegiea gigantea TaxID=171969 RepID=A0A9Q1GSH4_9CARY|nr:hypothetical protein Cgig2_007576 [Carnegiea gigantea]
MFLTCLLASTGGLIFGYDIGISSGVTSMSTFLMKFFPLVAKRSINKPVLQIHQPHINILFTSSLYLAALLSSFVASTITRKLGRRTSMFLGGLLFCAGAIVNAFDQNVAMLIVVPLFLSETTAFKHHGSLNMMFQLSITIDNLVANILNYYFSRIDNHGWRLALLIERGRLEEAKKKLVKTRGGDNVDTKLHDLVASSEASTKFTMINFIMFHASVLFKTIGFGNNASLMSAVVTGTVNVVATLVSIFDVFCSTLNARIQFDYFFELQILVTIFIGWKFGVNGDPTDLHKWYAVVLMTFICIYVAGFAWSWGPLGWLVPSEMLPREV